jgi:glutamate-5-semialdehyde dehydrogenase
MDGLMAVESTGRANERFGALAALAAPAQAAARVLAGMTTERKNAALRAMAGALEAGVEEILVANARDLEAAGADGAASAAVDRLRLDGARVRAMADGLRQIAALPDPVGEILERRTLPNGLEVEKVRVPMGVVGMIYEGRPNVTVDAAGLAVKSGNAVLLRGSRIAGRSNRELVRILCEAGRRSGLPEGAIQLVPPTREGARDLMRARGLVDVLIPRGGAELIDTVVRESLVPVIETGVGNCHVYVDATADLDKALAILVNAKVQRPSVCNAAESFLVHREVAEAFLPRALAALRAEGVEVRGDEAILARAGGDPGVLPATEDDYRAEFLDLRISGRVVDSLDEAIDHVNAFGTRHSEAIVTEDPEAAERFVREVDAAAVLVNASTRFTDGSEMGMGAEIGISTQKLHARGPMALPELTTYKFVVRGTGQIRT